MADKYSNSEDYKISSYNSAGNLIKRLDSLWEKTHRDCFSGNFVDWNIALDRLWLEISGDLKLDAPERNEMKKFNEKIAKLSPLISPNSFGFNKKTEKDILKIEKQRQILVEKEAYIKFMEGKLGLGKAYVDEFEDDFE